MNYDCRPYHSQATFNYPPFFLSDRNAPLSVSHVARPDPRACPISGSGTHRTGIGRDEDIAQSTGNVRRRIAVACARCRKRKIRCSGDPGNGTGCSNCKQAGVCLDMCQFHRVGSTDAVEAYSALALSSSVNSGFTHISNHNGEVSPYNADGHGFYNRGMLYPPHINTKSVGYPENWTIPNPEETSPVETYGLDQSTPYVSTPSTLASVYGQGYQWSGASLRNSPAGVHTYLNHDPPASYTANTLPYLQPGTNRSSNEALSSLKMTSISSALPISLPERRRPRQSQSIDSTAPQRQLPMPQPGPTQSTRNTVDLLQDQRLRSSQAASGNSMNLSSSSAKHGITWPNEASMSVSDSQSMASSEASSTDHLPQTTTAPSVTDVTNLTSVTLATASNIKDSVTLSAQPTLNFSTPTLLDTIPMSSSTYSNFRNYALPASSSSADPIHVLSRQSSERKLYNFSADSVTKRRSLDDHAPSGPLILSGHRYTPLGTAPQATSKVRQGSLENRQQVPLPGTSMSTMKRTN